MLHLLFMKTFIKSTGLFILIVLSAAAIILGSCGGGGGGGGSDGADSGGSAASQTGTAAILLRDAPAEEYNQIILCINKVTLEPGSEVAFEAKEGCVEVDLLEHQEKPFLLNVKDVPTGKYNQIRMTVDYIRTVGGSCDRLDIKLPSNVIKINPQGPFYINSGDKVVIDIDVKAKQSVNIHAAGQSGKCIFRPVILAEVKTIDDLLPEGKCPRILKGTITALNLDDNDDVTGFKLKLSHSKYNEVRVRINDETAVFDEDGSFTDPNALEVGQQVKVKGEFLKDLSILSSVVAIGDLINLHGTALTEVVDDKFEMELDPGQAVADEEIIVEVDSQDQTLILIDCRTEVDQDAIEPGIGVRAIGKLSEGKLIAVALFLEKPSHYGTIESMKDTGNGYDMEFTPANRTDSEIIFLPDAAIAKMEGDGPIEKDLLARLVNCNPRQARIELNELDDKTADLVAVKQEMTGGKIKKYGLNKKLEQITLESGEIIQIQEYATIIKDGYATLFKELEEGDVITVFGLADCEGNKNGIDFYGFVAIVENNDNCYDACDVDDDDDRDDDDDDDDDDRDDDDDDDDDNKKDKKDKK